MIGASQIYERLLRTGKAKKTCTACNRHLNDGEMVVFERYVRQSLSEHLFSLDSRFTSLLAQRANEEYLPRDN
jgi:hypothetical protein